MLIRLLLNKQLNRPLVLVLLKEACFLSQLNIKSKEFINRSIIIELHRNSLDFLLMWLSDFTNFTLKYKDIRIYVNQKKRDETLANRPTFDPNLYELAKKYLSFNS